MTELSFLIDLLLNEKLSKSVKTKIQERIKFIEAHETRPLIAKSFPQMGPSTIQAPSTQRIIDEIQAATASTENVNPAQPTTFAAAQALQKRAEAMHTAGKIEPGRTSARKF